jgi:hypothetical protein
LSLAIAVDTPAGFDFGETLAVPALPEGSSTRPFTNRPGPQRDHPSNIRLESICQKINEKRHDADKIIPRLPSNYLAYKDVNV